MIEAYLMLSGRIRRFSYFVYALLLWVVVLVLALLAIPMVYNARYPALAGILLSVLIGLFWIWATMALAVKSLHDLDKSGWHYLWMILVPGMLTYTISVQWKGAVDFSVGPVRGMLSPVAAVVLVLANLYLLLARGSDGPNRFGYPP